MFSAKASADPAVHVAGTVGARPAVAPGLKAMVRGAGASEGWSLWAGAKPISEGDEDETCAGASTGLSDAESSGSEPNAFLFGSSIGLSQSRPSPLSATTAAHSSSSHHFPPIREQQALDFCTAWTGGSNARVASGLRPPLPHMSPENATATEKLPDWCRTFRHPPLAWSGHVKPPPPAMSPAEAECCTGSSSYMGSSGLHEAGQCVNGGKASKGKGCKGGKGIGKDRSAPVIPPPDGTWRCVDGAGETKFSNVAGSQTATEAATDFKTQRSEVEVAPPELPECPWRFAELARQATAASAASPSVAMQGQVIDLKALFGEASEAPYRDSDNSLWSGSAPNIAHGSQARPFSPW
mmetsp:Transcript_8431/g.21621  ORF Transcript_8431/g.21621 Transcript_8431/m.21621 type:complete len:353 (-) Transcript_8431:99-1157(-)